MRRRFAVPVALVLLSASCSQARSAPPEAAAPESVTTRITSVTVAAPAPPTTLATTTTTATMTTSTTRPIFSADVQAIDGEIAAGMTSSWRPSCPVGLEDLRLVTLSHHTFDGGVATGELVVHQDVADDVVTVFAELFAAGFPIERMELVDVYDADDDRSMAANNTSAFNCRTVAGTNRWSQHAFGRAIDVNPLLNPYVRGSRIDPPEGSAYVDRSIDQPGLIRAGDAAVRAFAAIGWSWGGNWSSPDYQHFSANAR